MASLVNESVTRPVTMRVCADAGTLKPSNTTSADRSDLILMRLPPGIGLNSRLRDYGDEQPNACAIERGALRCEIPFCGRHLANIARGCQYSATPCVPLWDACNILKWSRNVSG